MSKLALINRNEKRKKLVKKFAKKHAALQSIVDDAKASEEVRFQARLATRTRRACATAAR